MEREEKGKEEGREKISNSLPNKPVAVKQHKFNLPRMDQPRGVVIRRLRPSPRVTRLLGSPFPLRT